MHLAQPQLDAMSGLGPSSVKFGDSATVTRFAAKPSSAPAIAAAGQIQAL
jgi:hypothetical protein